MPKLGRPNFYQSDQFMRQHEAFQRFAPFGTHYTPPQRVRIVGGKHITVREDRSAGTQMQSSAYDLGGRPKVTLSPRNENWNRYTPLPPIPAAQPVEPTPVQPAEQALSLQIDGTEKFNLLYNVRRQLMALAEGNTDEEKYRYLDELLKRTYIVLSNRDASLSGATTYRTLESTLNIMGIRLRADDLHLLALMFLSPSSGHRLGDNGELTVNYEKFLVMLEDLVRPPRPTSRGVQPLSTRTSHEENQLKKAFKNVDTMETGILSCQLIRQMCQHFRVPLEESDLRRLLELTEISELRNRQGYTVHNWPKFIQLTEELLQSVPVPTSSEPRVPHLHQTCSSYDQQLGLDRETKSNNTHLKETETPEFKKLPPLHDSACRGQTFQRRNSQPSNSIISHGEPPPPAARTKSWFDRFLDMASRLYKLDNHHHGILDSCTMSQAAGELNDTFQLGFEQDDLNGAALAALVPGGHGKANIDAFLRTLSRKRQ